MTKLGSFLQNEVVLKLKFVYFEKATKFCKISIVDLTITTLDKSTLEISQKLVTFSEYINFNTYNQR